MQLRLYQWDLLANHLDSASCSDECRMSPHFKPPYTTRPKLTRDVWNVQASSASTSDVHIRLDVTFLSSVRDCFLLALQEGNHWYKKK